MYNNERFVVRIICRSLSMLLKSLAFVAVGIASLHESAIASDITPVQALEDSTDAPEETTEAPEETTEAPEETTEAPEDEEETEETTEAPEETTEAPEETTVPSANSALSMASSMAVAGAMIVATWST